MYKSLHHYQSPILCMLQFLLFFNIKATGFGEILFAVLKQLYSILYCQKAKYCEQQPFFTALNLMLPSTHCLCQQWRFHSKMAETKGIMAQWILNSFIYHWSWGWVPSPCRLYLLIIPSSLMEERHQVI